MSGVRDAAHSRDVVAQAAVQLGLFPEPAPAPAWSFASAVCHGCGTVGCTIWEGGNGHPERTYCGLECAAVDGWPWLGKSGRRVTADAPLLAAAE